MVNRAHAHHAQVTILIDFVHVLEYVWKAAWCLFAEADPAAESWVRTQGLRLLHGHSDQVITTLRPATASLPAGQRTGVYACALPSAEAVLTLRALHSNGDFDDYWNYHLTQEKHRIHETCYQKGRRCGMVARGLLWRNVAARLPTGGGRL